ncbi:MAG: formate dehydrogenase accessory sulfurtransferase FdhD [Syntrophaceticus schinkii]
MLTTPRKIIQFGENGCHEVEDIIVCETTLTVYVNSKETATLVCSPRDQAYLAVGFLCAEGVLKKREDLRTVNLDAEQGAVYIETNPDLGLADKLFVKRCITPSAGRSGASVSTAGVTPAPPPYFISA